MLHKDSLHVSNEFSHASLTLDFGYALLRWSRHNIEVLGGAGYNGITVLKVANPVDTSKPKSVESNGLLLSAGLGYRYDFPVGSYLGISAKYNFTHFDNLGGTDLTGNFLSINLSLGLISRDREYDTRQLLDMK